MIDIQYTTGDATRPIGYSLSGYANPDAGNHVIVHCCNNIGAWGAGFVLALSERWPMAEKKYRGAFDGSIPAPHELGDVIWANVHGGLPGDRTDLFVANLIGQDGVGRNKAGRPPIRYDAIDQGLLKIGSAIVDRYPAQVHMPRMGCGLAGGDWGVIEALVKSNLSSYDIPVTVYDFP